ncbi:MAG: hypothetical protein ACYCUM_11150 [Solirubrobacteraceae bacterium]
MRHRREHLIALSHVQRMQRFVAAGLLLVGTGAVLSACGGAGGTGGAKSASSIVSLIVAGNVTAQGEVAAADVVLTGECMRRRGFTFATVPPKAAVAVERVSPLLSRGTVAAVPSEASALSAARSYGFGVAAVHSSPVASSGGAEYATSGSGVAGHSKVSPRERTYEDALDGPKGQNGRFTVAGIAQHIYSTEGCAAQAERDLYGSPLLAVQASYLPEDLNLAVAHDVATNQSYLTTARRWSRCLAGATGRQVGAEPYNVANELLATEERQSGPLTTQQRSYEVEVAEDDIRCQYSSGFISTSVALRRRFATHLDGPYEGLLLTILEARARADRKAQSVLAAAGR